MTSHGPLLPSTRELDGPADRRVDRSKEIAGEPLVEDHNAPRRLPWRAEIVGGEQAASKERDPERLEVAGRPQLRRPRALQRGVGRVPRDPHARGRVGIEERRGVLREGDRLDAAACLQPLHELLHVLVARRLVVAHHPGPHEHRGDAPRIEAELHPAEILQGSHEQQRADDERERRGQLHDGEHRCGTEPTARHRRSGGLEHLRRLHADGASRGQDREQQPHDQREHGGEAEHAPVHRHVGDRRPAGQRHALHQASQPDRQERAANPSERPERHAFGQVLPQQPETARAERLAHGGLGPAADAAHDEKVGDVRARDQQDEGAQPHHQRQRCRQTAPQERVDADRTEDVKLDLLRELLVRLRVLLGEPRGERLQLRLRLLAVDARRQPRHPLVESAGRARGHGGTSMVDERRRDCPASRDRWPARDPCPETPAP